MKTLFALIFLLGISVGVALKCELCLTTYGWDDCKNKVKTLVCSNREDRCAKADMEMESLDGTAEFYAKGCTTSSECSQKKCDSLTWGRSASVTKCDIHCCNGDLCNGAQVPMINTILLLACAIIAFVCYFKN